MMTRTSNDKLLFQSRGSTRHFLFSRTDPRRIADVKPKKISVAHDRMKTVFPDMLVDNRFIEHAMLHLDMVSQFGAMIIRLDQEIIENNSSKNPQVFDHQIQIAKILDKICQNGNGLWGLVNPDALGSFFAEKSGSEILQIAKKLQKYFSKQTQKTVTIGVSAFPTLTYKKEEILENAYKALDHASFFGPNSAVIFDDVSLNISGDKLYEKGDIQGTIAEFKKALLINSSNVNVRNSLGVCYGIAGNYEQAAEEFCKAIDIDKNEYMTLYNLGLVNMLTGEREKALDFFLKAHDINSDIYEVAFQTGKLYLEMGNSEQATVFLERAAKIEPESVAVYRYLGDCYAVSDRTDDAISAYEKSIKYNPCDAASMSALGSLYDKRNENSEIALMFCRESVELSPENSLFRYRLGRLYYHQKRFKEALMEFKKAKRLGRDTTEYIEKTNSYIDNQDT
ncbi:MAG: tetratricopeptide repeat protein [Desulfobacterales bacterium]